MDEDGWRFIILKIKAKYICPTNRKKKILYDVIKKNNVVLLI